MLKVRVSPKKKKQNLKYNLLSSALRLCIAMYSQFENYVRSTGGVGLVTWAKLRPNQADSFLEQ